MFFTSRYRASSSKWMLFVAILVLSCLPEFKSNQVEVRHFSVPAPGLPVLFTPTSSFPGTNEAFRSDYEVINSFLREGKQFVNDFLKNNSWTVPESSKVCFVMGNEAADLDSIVTAITLGLHLSVAERQDGWIYVPLINIPRADLVLRKDASFLLDFTGVSVADLVFIDELDLQSIVKEESNSGKFSVILTDHNQLSESQSFLKPFVTGIFDHHTNDHEFDNAPLRFYQIEPVGSCASLVALEMKLYWQNHPDAESILTPNVASLLMSVILLDTVNFNPQEKKTTDTDLLAYMWLYTRYPVAHESLYRVLLDLRSDTSGMSTVELFRKDLKFRVSAGTRYAISSVSGRALQDWLSEDVDLFDQMLSFSKNINVSLFCLLTNGVTSGSIVMRDLVCMGSNSDLLDTISESLAESGFVQQSLDMNDLKESSPNLLVRLNNSSSRKRISPVIHEAVNQQAKAKASQTIKDSI